MRGFYTAVAWSRMLVRALAKGDFLDRDFFLLQFFLLKKNVLFFESFQRRVLLCFFAKEDTLGKVLTWNFVCLLFYEEDVVYVCGENNTR